MESKDKDLKESSFSGETKTGHRDDRDHTVTIKRLLRIEILIYDAKVNFRFFSEHFFAWIEVS